MKLLNALKASFIASLLVLGMACGNNTDDDVIVVPPGTDQPVIIPVEPAPVEAPPTVVVPVPSITWTDLYERESQGQMHILVGRSCPAPRDFRIRSDGTFSAMCAGQAPQNGSISPSELRELSRRIRSVISFGLGNTSTCYRTPTPTADDDFWLKLNTNGVYQIRNSRVNEPTPPDVCYKGGRTNVENVRSYVHRLMNRYFPSPAPNPSPSPTVTVTPTPTPTPTATFTALPQ